MFHQVAYGLLTAGTIFRGFYVMEWDLRPKLSQRNPAECDRYMRQMYQLAVTGLWHPLTALVLRKDSADAWAFDKGYSCSSPAFSCGT